MRKLEWIYSILVIEDWIRTCHTSHTIYFFFEIYKRTDLFTDDTVRNPMPRPMKARTPSTYPYRPQGAMILILLFIKFTKTELAAYLPSQWIVTISLTLIEFPLAKKILTWPTELQINFPAFKPIMFTLWTYFRRLHIEHHWGWPRVIFSNEILTCNIYMPKTLRQLF